MDERRHKPPRQRGHRRAPRSRLHAVTACEERGFKPGDIIVSDEWKHPRRIREINVLDVWLSVITGKITQQTHVSSFPKDVRLQGT